MNDKLFKVAGVATDTNGKTTIRYANDVENRTKVLLRNGFVNVQLVDLGGEYDKDEACQLLLKRSDFDKYTDIINIELDRISRIDDEYSIKIKRKDRKLALANLTAEKILDFIKN